MIFKVIRTLTGFVTTFHILTGGNTNSKARLHKKPSRQTDMISISKFYNRHQPIIVMTAILSLLFIFCIIMMAIGASTLESGQYYNHLLEVIA